MLRLQKLFPSLILVALIGLFFMTESGCMKEQFGNGQITFSTDTLTFDTVFTSVGSTTRYFKVFNRDKKSVRISDIRLMHLVGTQFRINVDGVSGDQFTNVEIPPRDSIYVFVEVTVDPNSSATPFVIVDDVSFTANGANKVVHLQAFGQNAHFHYGEELTSSATWSNDLPHVIVNSDSVPGVYVRCGATLNILPGTKVFFAGNSAIFVEGNLRAEATSWSDSIVFRGARLESYYSNKPGQWFGIVFLRNDDCISTGSFDHCVITESSYGVYAGAGLSADLATYQGSTRRPTVTVKNSIVKNSQYNAVYGFNAKVTAENSIFYIAGDNLLKFGLGGEYTFRNCTVFNKGSRYVDHKTETLLLSNFVADGNNTVYPEPLKTVFENCVIYGSLQNEISFNNIDENDFTNFDNSFIFCDVKTKEDTFNLFATVHNQILFNQDPRFRDEEEGNFTPYDSSGYFSPLIDTSTTGLPTDIYGTSRPQRIRYDIGAIEVQ